MQEPGPLPAISQLSNTGSFSSTPEETFEPSPLQLRENIQKVTIEGFRTLGIVSTFVASVEAQCLGLISDVSGHPKLSEVASALLLIGILLSAFGAVLSLLSARWFELLTGKDLDILRDRVMAARTEGKRCRTNAGDSGETSRARHIYSPERTYELQGEICTHGPTWKDYIVSKAVGSATMVVCCGLYTFILGMVIYGWIAYSLATAAVNTFIAMLCATLVVLMHLDFCATAVLNLMPFKRVRL